MRLAGRPPHPAPASTPPDRARRRRSPARGTHGRAVAGQAPDGPRDGEPSARRTRGPRSANTASCDARRRTPLARPAPSGRSNGKSRRFHSPVSRRRSTVSACPKNRAVVTHCSLNPSSSSRNPRPGCSPANSTRPFGAASRWRAISDRSSPTTCNATPSTSQAGHSVGAGQPLASSEPSNSTSAARSGASHGRTSTSASAMAPTTPRSPQSAIFATRRPVTSPRRRRSMPSGISSNVMSVITGESWPLAK